MNKYNVELEDQIISKVNELYINFRQYFTILSPQGKYLSSQAMKGNPKLSDNWVRNHIREKQSLVVFSGKEISKFLCFDVDIKDKVKAKWVTYKIIDQLKQLGFSDTDIHVATSGNKGYHVLLFIKDGTSLSNLRLIFDTVLRNEELERFDYGQVEFRPNHTQGVKLELSRNFKNTETDNQCWFVYNDSLNKITNKEYILGIEPIEKDTFNDILDYIKDEHRDTFDVKQEMELIEKLDEPESHKLHRDEDTTIDRARELLVNGLFICGSRHNSILLLAKYFRYMGLELNDCVEHLSVWMKGQDKKYYTSTLEFALEEVKRVSNLVYEKEYNLVSASPTIRIYKSEMEQISTIRNKNLRLIMYSMMTHSKRYAMQNGVFYMTYKQIGEMVGMNCEKNILSNVNKLSKECLVEFVERNIKQGKGLKNKPNKYRLNITEDVNCDFYDLSYEDIINNIEITHNKLLVDCLPLHTIKNNLPQLQYLELRKLVI